MKKPVKILLILTLVAGLSGCATPERRIQKSQEIFAGFPAEVQENVRRGEIDVGYTKDMVRIALGNPDRVYMKRTRERTTETWAFVKIYFEPDRYYPDYYPSHGPYRDDVRWRESEWFFWERDRERESEYLRIEFENDRVISIEQITR